MKDSLTQLFKRDLTRLKKELNEFKSPELIWITPEEIANSSGHLVLHLCGNLRHFIGKTLGEAEYIRDRHAEFNSSPIPLSALEKLIDDSAEEIEKALSEISPSDIQKTYPIEVFGNPMSTEYFLIHLHGHLTYHLGQITYLRRVL